MNLGTMGNAPPMNIKGIRFESVLLRQLILGTIASVHVVGCGRSSAPPVMVQPGAYDLSPGNVGMDAPGKLQYSIFNLGSSPVPAKAYTVELYVDGKLASFDRATSMILPGHKTDYTSPHQLSPGQHSYECKILWASNVRDSNESNDVMTGSFEVK